MDLLEVIGPVMIGPSSSHTAGAVRLGLIAGMLLDEAPVEGRITLHGSFARTGLGHGTDKAIAAGILGFGCDDPRVRDSFEKAREKGLDLQFWSKEMENVHPNTALIYLKGAAGSEVQVLGSSIGGGRVLITRVNGMDTSFSGQYNTLLILHKDHPGMVARVAGELASSGINIASMRVERSRKHGKAMMVIESDENVTQQTLGLLRQIPDVERVMYFHTV
jgi:L-serine dehydratase